MGLIKRISNEVTYLRTALRALKRVNGVYETPNRTFSDVIEDLARTKPNNIAILFEDQSITYAQLNAAANRSARWVRFSSRHVFASVIHYFTAGQAELCLLRRSCSDYLLCGWPCFSHRRYTMDQ